MKVRALPTWRNPVGDGANRTRGFNAVVLLNDLPLEVVPDNDAASGEGLLKESLIGNYCDVTGGGKLSSSRDPRGPSVKSNTLREFANFLECT